MDHEQQPGAGRPTDPDSGTTPDRRRSTNSEGWRLWTEIREQLGERYHDCRLGNFEPAADPEIRGRQERVVRRLRAYQDNIASEVREGRGLVLFGPAGTGKDHLLAAMMQAATWGHGLAVAWRNGMDLFAELRDSIDSKRPERELIAELTRPDVLAISDPLPPFGSLTEWQASFLFRLLDQRYRRRRPVWATANFASGTEAAERLGEQLLDRLKDGAVSLHCNWPSYRRAADSLRIA